MESGDRDTVCRSILNGAGERRYTSAGIPKAARRSFHAKPAGACVRMAEVPAALPAVSVPYSSRNGSGKGIEAIS